MEYQYDNSLGFNEIVSNTGEYCLCVRDQAICFILIDIFNGKENINVDILNLPWKTKKSDLGAEITDKNNISVAFGNIKELNGINKTVELINLYYAK